MGRVTAFISVMFVLLFEGCSSGSVEKTSKENISFYDVPLVCGADTSIGCGSRIKPLFIESAKQKEIKESWVNRQGTVIAFVWADGVTHPDIAQKLFGKFEISATPIKDKSEISRFASTLDTKQGWYEGMAVDSLSLHEAGTIAATSTKVVSDAGIITPQEAALIKPEIEDYFRKELVMVRTFDELVEDQDKKWMDASTRIYAAHIGEERAAKAGKYYADYLAKKKAEEEKCMEDCKNKKDCCSKK